MQLQYYASVALCSLAPRFTNDLSGHSDPSCTSVTLRFRRRAGSNQQQRECVGSRAHVVSFSLAIRLIRIACFGLCKVGRNSSPGDRAEGAILWKVPSIFPPVIHSNISRTLNSHDRHSVLFPHARIWGECLKRADTLETEVVRPSC
jgi:hypothetical protein